ncbi:MAG TPA: adenylate kinase [Candidatus Syntrophoarchaeum butanivorans]|uniref:Adenylate kinase n=1 Tax=Candidatus Syntropharchaeum butanivorans TaxID=1839936 RepID=A0A7C0X3Z7_9EURY|nr:MAG: adenylate kinase [Candidatus Syntrophoarchaeum sp. WYZ-LMO15]HDM36186.1 adenylate kinase [Candidatus Syntrophoarchaeum butanivorans]
MSVIILTGIPGVGSSTVVKEALRMMGDGSESFRPVNFGDVMFEIAEKRGLVKTRDEMRKLNSEEQRDIQLIAAERISKMGGRVILDTHCTVKTPQGYLPGLPAWVLDTLKPEQIILIEADPEEIHQRRLKDRSRSRDPDPVELINEHQQVNRMIAMAYAARTGATVKFIANHDNGLEEAANELLKVISG